MRLQYEDNIDEATDVQYELAELTGAISSRRWVGFIVPTLVLAGTLLLFLELAISFIDGLVIAIVVLAWTCLPTRRRFGEVSESHLSESGIGCTSDHRVRDR